MQRYVSGARGLCVGGLLACMASTAAAQYSKGFEWNRKADWTPGVEQGSRTHNPGPDAAGNASWSYEVGHGDGLGSDSPWYAQPTTPMTWDAAWWDTGEGAWSMDDERNPPIFADRMTHNLGPAGFGNIPVVRWRNPVGDGAMLDMAGTLQILWTGEGFVGAPTDVDVVIAIFDASAQATSVLLQTTVSKPHMGLSIGDSQDVLVDLKGIMLDAGDSILVSARGHDMLASQWVAVHDSGLTITLVPAPGGVALLLSAGILGARRRRR